jgi:hypothetical protein
MIPFFSLLFLLPLASFADDCDLLPVEKSAGNAIVITAAGEKSVLDENSSLAKGDSLATGKLAWVELRLCDGSALKVGEKSKFKFEDAAKEADGFAGWAFELLKGSLLAAVQGEQKSDKVKLRVRTPTASIGVRGTEFLVESDDAEGTSLHTIEGEVLLGAQEDFDQLRDLKGNELASKFESVPKEKMSRIARGEKRAAKAAAFTLASLQQKKTELFEHRIALLKRSEAVKVVAKARKKLNERTMNANNGKQKDPDKAGVESSSSEKMPGAAVKTKEMREEKAEERKEKRDEKMEEKPQEKSKDLTERFEEMVKNKKPSDNPGASGAPPGVPTGFNKMGKMGNPGGQGQGQGQGQRRKGQGGGGLGGGQRRGGN